MTFPPLKNLKRWTTTVTVIKTGGRDDDGDVLESTSYSQSDCLVALRSTNDPVDRSSVNTAEAILYAPVDADIDSTDRIEVPEGSFLPGTWAVDGHVMHWPFGVEVPLRRE